MIRLLPILLLCSTTPSSYGFLASQQQGQQRDAANIMTSAVYLSPSLSSSNNNVPSSSSDDDTIRNDIEAMREEAKKRLQSLNLQMEDMLKKHNQEEEKAASSNSFLGASAFEDAELPVVQVASTAAADNVEDKIQSKVDDSKTVAVVAPPNYMADSSLLHNTRWKVVVQIGGRQVDATVEKPLLVHLVIDFTPETLHDNDELLKSGFSTEPAKVLHIKESWVGASSVTEGRQRDVKIKSVGGWKVLPGQGPKGIDILRYYIDVEEEICHNNNNKNEGQTTTAATCPAKRIYFTSGFFSMGHHNESEAFKDYLRGELDRLTNKYDDLAMEDENDERLLSVDKVKRVKTMMDLRKQIKSAHDRITQARIRDPEKAMLRLSRRRDFGVTKEGQVCCKVTHGMSAEYHVLGKMEMASVNKPIIEAPADSSSTSSSTLRP